MKTVKIIDLGNHHSGIHNGYKVVSTILKNCVRRVYNKKEALELAKYWENEAKSLYK